MGLSLGPGLTEKTLAGQASSLQPLQDVDRGKTGLWSMGSLPPLLRASAVPAEGLEHPVITAPSSSSPVPGRDQARDMAHW